jgi:hypothetical protein
MDVAQILQKAVDPPRAALPYLLMIRRDRLVYRGMAGDLPDIVPQNQDLGDYQ